MNKNISKSLIVLASTFLLTGCGCSDNSKKEDDRFIDFQPEIVENDKVYMSIFDEVKYTPDSKYTFDVEVADPSLVSYEGGYFITNTNTGNTTAHFVCGIISYDVEIYVSKSSIVPAFDIQYNNISMFTKSAFSVDVNLSYNGRDVINYIGDVKITNEENNGFVTALYNKATKKIDFTSTEKGAGTDRFSIYTEFLGYTLSRSITVTTKENNSLSISGYRLSFNDNGPVYKISTYQYNDNPIDLATDLVLKKGNTQISYGEVSVISGNESIVKLNGSKIELVKAGNSYLDITYQGQTIRVYIEISKPIIKTEPILVEDKDFNLNLKPVWNDETGYSYSNPKGYRTYEHDALTEKEIKLPGDIDFEGLVSVTVNGRTISVKDSDYLINNEDDILTLKSSIFDETIYGLCPIDMVLDAGEYLVKYTTSLYFITKVLTTNQDIIDNVQVRYDTDQIFGVYVLGNDIDRDGYLFPGFWIQLGGNLGNESYGFRGVFDGAGHSILNAKAHGSGLAIKYGAGSVISNLNFTNCNYTFYPYTDPNQYSNTIFGRYLYGTVIDNVTISFDNESVLTADKKFLDKYPTGSAVQPGKGQVGLLVNEHAVNCVFRNLTVDASGKEVLRLLGNKTTGTIYENVVVKAKDLKYIAELQTSATGITLEKN